MMLVLLDFTMLYSASILYRLYRGGDALPDRLQPVCPSAPLPSETARKIFYPDSVVLL